MSRPEAVTSRSTYGTPERTAWTGWVVFASTMMILVGCFQLIEGLVAIFDDGFYRVTDSGLVVQVNYNVWGWTHLLIGAVLIAAGAGVFAGNIVARTVAVGVAMLSALLNLLFIAAYPLWSLTIIAVDVLVIYALIVHGREMKNS
jgi:hypothetical protein